MVTNRGSFSFILWPNTTCWNLITWNWWLIFENWQWHWLTKRLEFKNKFERHYTGKQNVQIYSKTLIQGSEGTCWQLLNKWMKKNFVFSICQLNVVCVCKRGRGHRLCLTIVSLTVRQSQAECPYPEWVHQQFRS